MRETLARLESPEIEAYENVDFLVIGKKLLANSEHIMGVLLLAVAYSQSIWLKKMHDQRINLSLDKAEKVD